MTARDPDDQRGPKDSTARATDCSASSTGKALIHGRIWSAAALIAVALLVNGCGWISDAFFADEKPPDPPFAVNNELDSAIERWSGGNWGIRYQNIRDDSIAFFSERFPRGSRTEAVFHYFLEIGGACAPEPKPNTYIYEYCKVKIKGVLDPVYKQASYRGYELLWQLNIASTSGSATGSTDFRQVERLSLRLGQGGSGYIPDGDFSGVAMDCPNARQRLNDPAIGPESSAFLPLHQNNDVFDQ